MKENKSSHQKKAPFFKCRLCGKLVKVTVWRKHLFIEHNIGKLIKYRDYFNDDLKKKCKCKKCNQIIIKTDWSGHLLKKHGIGDKIRFQDYYISPNQSIQESNKKWYDSNKKKKQQIQKNWRCGDVLNGAPKATIIYNALCTNRRKH